MWKSLLVLCLTVGAAYATDCLCDTNNGGCGSHATCYGGYDGPESVTCVCDNGYYMSGGVCVGVNACATANGGCSEHATCSPTIGTYERSCACIAPYTGDGWYCEAPAANLCATSNGGCGIHATCYGGVNAPVTCVCVSGYVMTGDVCVGVNACDTNNGGCSAHATCIPVIGTYDRSCECVTPYEGDGWYCALPEEGQGGGGTGGGGGQPQFGNWDCPPEGGSQWDWRYPQPTCTSLTVFYPSWPELGRNDVNVRIRLSDNTVLTLNFHNDVADWSGQVTFDFTTHPNWPAGTTGQTVEWVQVGGSNCHWHGAVTCPVDTPTEEPGEEPFDWNWEYPAPECEGLTVTYPSDIPGDQANDVNIRIVVNGVEHTLNFHFNTGFWSGLTFFDIVNHPNFPSGTTTYTIVWVQVGGTNYHWEGTVTCP